MTATRIALAVAACAAVVHLGALGNRFAMDDLYIIVLNPLVHERPISPDSLNGEYPAIPALQGGVKGDNVNETPYRKAPPFRAKSFTNLS